MAVLTIDDVPSNRFREKLAWLGDRGIPALFFVWGEKAAEAEESLVDAVRAGYTLGNHSWTHPHFSALDSEAALQEIELADDLIECIYRRAGVPWTSKRFRFPYFDRGATPMQSSDFQRILAEYGYTALGEENRGDRDTLCQFDQAEYWLGNPDAPANLNSPESILERIGPGHPAAKDVILIHDHDYSHDLFFECVERYGKLGIEFERPA